jgi:hypothetical protein
MERLGAIMKSCQNNWSPSKVLNPESPAYDEVLTTLPRRSVLKLFEEDDTHVPLFVSMFHNVMSYDGTHSNALHCDNTDLAYTLFMNCNTSSLCCF